MTIKSLQTYIESLKVDFKSLSKRLDDLHPYVKYLALELYVACKKKGINIIFTSTYRSIAEQNELYAQGRTKAGGIITNARGGDSWHNWRCAFDICVIINGKATWDTKYYKQVYEVAKTIPNLEWGGNFVVNGKPFPDMPHYQYRMGLTIKDMKKGKVPKFPVIPTDDITVDDAINYYHSKGTVKDDVGMKSDLSSENLSRTRFEALLVKSLLLLGIKALTLDGAIIEWSNKKLKDGTPVIGSRQDMIDDFNDAKKDDKYKMSVDRFKGFLIKSCKYLKENGK